MAQNAARECKAYSPPARQDKTFPPRFASKKANGGIFMEFNARKDVSSMTMAKSEKNSIWVQADADIDDMIFQAQGSSEEATCSER